MSSEDGFLGLTAGSLPARPPVFVDPQASVVQAARAMRAAQATACLVGTPEAVQGILTERDVVRAVAEDAAPDAPARDFMSREVVTISGRELVSEAFLAMLRHKIRRLGLTGPDGRITGILEERDLLAARFESPVALAADIARAADAWDLARAHATLTRMTPRWLGQGAGVDRVGAMAAAVRDQLFARAAVLALETADPGPMALLALGSEGRREQFLATDQDNALVLGDGADLSKAHDYALRLMELLDQAGLPPCPHGVTADRDDWRMTLPHWETRLEELARNPGPEAVLALSMLADARQVHGSRELAAGLSRALAQAVSGHPIALRAMAREAVRFTPPLTIFGSLSVQDGALDIKRGGIFPLTQGARVLGLECGARVTGTAGRLEAAVRAGFLAEGTATNLSQALDFMQELRLRFQARDLDRGREPGNRVLPGELTPLERSRLQECFKAVASFQEMLENRYKLKLFT
ncbi:hypothetical protein NNJEOMEG_00871 [Fundidesulfovibrio magnetotacticus]|uniref:CBS domain-containing protein n=1 Tax=Fundidesulfovibrio magnetotacticus TaxID=2730080 RepID=A0A6V8LJY6_9BACT|nr:putative nucleotidyltransferase substrate binding domain-containing protein [Fundidesulfovibrio magnetotacticus]GFK93042.1 hypothetical protein NNJEOMEG_00871 [Fundidesulfovibrio magnetotacticus]